VNDVNFDLRTLTRAERIWLWRRRQPTGLGGRGRNGSHLSASEAAPLLGFNVSAFLEAERGCDSPYEAAVWEAVREREPNGSAPDLAELCALARRRSKTSVLEACAALGGVSKPYFSKLEVAGADELVAFWQARGYVFGG
jgi:hypothetical protein